MTATHWFMIVIQIFPLMAWIVTREINALKRRSFELPIGHEMRQVCAEEAGDLSELRNGYLFIYTAFMLIGICSMLGGL